MLVHRERCPSCASLKHRIWGPALYPHDFMPLWGLYDNGKLAAYQDLFKNLIPNGIHLSKCDNCSMIFAESIPNEELANVIYNDLLGDEAISYARSKRQDKRYLVCRISRLLFDLAKYSQGKIENLRVLDFGCGWGDVMEAMAFLGTQVQGIEVSRQKRAHVESLGLSVASVLSEAKVAPPYDVILLWQVLEHVQEPFSTLEMLRSVAHKNTVLFVGVPHFTEQRLRQEFRKSPSARSKDLNPLEHLNYFDGHTLTQVARNAGWRRLYTMQPILDGPMILPQNREVRSMGSSLWRNVRFALTYFNPRSRNIALGTYIACTPETRF